MSAAIFDRSYSIPRKVIVLLRSLAGVQEDLDKGDARPVFVSAGVGIVYGAMTFKVYRRIHTEGHCLGCWSIWSDDELGDVAAMGLYRYEHATDNVIAGPYALCAQPVKPLTLGSIPQALHKHVVRFKGRFAQAKNIQPVEHWPSEAWGASWLSSDGKTVRAIPGREDDYAKEYGESIKIWTEGGYQAASPSSPNAVRSGSAATKPWWKIW